MLGIKVLKIHFTSLYMAPLIYKYNIKLYIISILNNSMFFFKKKKKKFVFLESLEYMCVL